MLLSEEQELIRETARELAKKIVAPLAEEADQSCVFPAKQISAIADAGMLLIKTTDTLGGGGGDNVMFTLLIEELAKECGATAVTVAVQSLCADCITIFGTEEQKQKYIPKMATGEIIAAFAMTEANAGTDASAQEAVVEDKGDHYLLNGTKCYVTHGDMADIAIVTARTDANSTSSNGLSAFIVDKSQFKVNKEYNKMGVRGSHTVNISFHNAVVPKENLLGKLGKGFKIAMTALNCGRIGVAAAAVGIIQGCMEASVAYAKQRAQFGKPVVENQAIQWMLADMYKDVSLARQMTWHAAVLADNDQNYSMQASAAKLFGSEAAMNAAVNAVQIHGGYGYCKPAKVERMFRDAKVVAIYEGTSEVQKMIIAGNLLK
jgi:butyryl-CoA dehydrogenase